MLTRSDAIRVDRDYRYTGEDAHSFVRCCLCRCYTPFIFYVVSKKALDVIANTLPVSSISTPLLLFLSDALFMYFSPFFLLATRP